MKRVVISEEEKKRIELRVNEIQKRRKKPRGNCLKCNKNFRIHRAEKRGHPGYCCELCALGKKRPASVREREAHLKEKKRTKKQVSRNKKKKAPYDFYSSDAWRELRYKILRRFGFKCLACGMAPPGVVLHVDHIKPRSKFPELELDQSNLQVLCEACNLGKLNYFDDDLRPK